MTGYAAPTIGAVLNARDPRRFRDLTLAEFVDRLASPEPIPGGGSAAAVAASLGAALVTMVASLSIGREKYAPHATNLQDVASMGRRLALRLLELADEDSVAYGRYAAALKLPRDTAELRHTRAVEVAGAARLATEVPLETVRACLEVVVAAERLAGRSNVNAASDLSVASLLAEACSKAAAANVLVNLPATKDPEWSVEVTRTVMELLDAVEDIARMTRETVGGRESRPPIEPPAGEALQVMG